MFTSKEVSFLRAELSAYIEKAQQVLENDQLADEKRERIENRLITTVSIVNKLQHAKPESEEKTLSVRILVVDDTESMRGIIKHFLMQCGFKRVDVAEDGLRGLALMKKAFQEGDPYKLVISDWEMPKMTGIQFLKKVRIDKDLWDTPFHILTTLSDKKYIVTALNNGVTGYLVKPVNQKMINDKFKDYLNT